MKQGYEYNNGKVFIYDENFKSIERDYQDNITEVIKKENEIEFLEKKIEELKTKNKELEDYLSTESVSWTIVKYIEIIITTTLALPIMGSLLLQRNLNELLTLLGGVKGYIGTFLPLVTFGLSPICLKKCNQINLCNKEKKSNDSQIEYIESYLSELKNELKKINDIKTKDNEPTGKTINKIPFNNIRVMKAILALIEEAGLEEEKYLEYLRMGILREKLSKYYDDREINVIEDFLQNKEKKLEKKYQD